MIPDIAISEWSKLITNDQKVKNFALQMKLNGLRLDYKLNRTDLEDAAKDLREFCVNNENMVGADVKAIFRM
jgi:hypothetical protein